MSKVRFTQKGGGTDKGAYLFITPVWAILLGIMLSVCSIPAFAVDGRDTHALGLFELDGNPQDSSSLAEDDWENLWFDCGYALYPTPYDPDTHGGPCGTSDRFTGIIADPAGTSNFTGGGSKDINDISGNVNSENYWLHKEGSEPDKNDITNGFAAAYQLDGDATEYCAWVDNDSSLPRPEVVEIFLCGFPPGTKPSELDLEYLHREDDTIIYFGTDRFTNNGDAFLGFWFFQDKVEQTNESQQGGKKFKGVHKQGDTLVLVDFPQGTGKEPVIKVYVWDADLTGLPNVDEDGHDIGPLEMIYNSKTGATSALCDGNGGKLACAITNADTVPAGMDDDLWPYAPKGGVEGDDYPYETFYSGGINISRLIGGGRCFSSFMAESRSSRSETAALKDFVLGSFPLCSSDGVTEIHWADHTVIPESTDVSSVNAVVGDWVHDKVTLIGEILGSGTPPDPGVDADPQVLNVTFKLYNNLTCTPGVENVNVLHESTGTLTGNGDGTSWAKSGSYLLTLTGGHSYQASWAGDTNYPAGVLSPCEPFYVIQPQLRIIKDVNSCLLDDTQDQGTFDLLYKLSSDTSYTTAASGVGDGGDSLYFGVYPGSYVVNETMSKTGEYVMRFPQGENYCNTSGEVTLAGDDMKTCFIQNVRKPHLIVKKQIVGALPDSGLFNLQVNDVTLDSTSYPTNTSYVSGNGSNVTHGGQVEIRIDGPADNNDPAGFGSFTVGETAGTSTLLSYYQTSIMCDDVNTTQAVFESTSTAARKVTGISLTAGDVITCTITNIVMTDAADCPIQ